MTPTLWNRCLSQLENELTEQQLNTYIRPLQAHEQGDVLRIMAPNRFVLTKVLNNFYPRINEIAASISDKENLTVDLVIGTGSLAPINNGVPAMAGEEEPDVQQQTIGNRVPTANQSPKFDTKPKFDDTLSI